MLINILFLNPIPIYKRWPFPADFVKVFVFNPPSVTFPQLAACLPQAHTELLDGVIDDPSLATFKQRLENQDIVALTVPSNLVALNAELNIHLIKKIKPNCKVVLGGLHPSVYHEEWLSKEADFVVRREGEITFPELITTIENQGNLREIKGLSFKEKGEIVVNPERPFMENLDDVPIPKWDLVDYSSYRNTFTKNGYIGTIETSRGCPFSCDFCLVSEVWKKRQRFKSAERVLVELEMLVKKRIERLSIADDNFGGNPKRDRQILEGILRRNIKIKWMSFARADYIRKNPDFYRLAARAGLDAVLVGFETLDMESFSKINKGYDQKLIAQLKDYQEIYHFLKGIGIFTIGLFITGHPQEEVEGMKYTLRNYDSVCDFPLITSFRPESSKYILQKDTVSGREKKNFFYFDSQMKFGNNRNYLMFRALMIIWTFFRFKNISRVLCGTYFEKSFFRSLFSFLVVCLFKFHRYYLNNIYYYIRYPNGISLDFYKKNLVDRFLKKR